LQRLRATLERATDEIRHEFFLQPHVRGRVVPRHFRLDHPELGEVTPRLGFLGAKRRTERVDLPERRSGRLAIKLSGLREVCLSLLEVIRLEQATAFADRCREDRRVDAQKATLVKEIVDRLLDLIAYRKDRALPITAKPEVPVIEEKIDTVLLRLYRIIERTRSYDLELGDGNLESARRTCVGANFAANDYRCFQRQRCEALPHLRRQRILDEDQIGRAHV